MSAKASTSSEKVIFYTLLLLWLCPIWTVGYVVTGDAPCHLYNSQILLDWAMNNHKDMYGYFMKLNTHLDPNWLTNLIQAPLLAVFSPSLAEKIFFTIYALSFAFGFRLLIRQINPKALFLSSVGMLFMWNHIVFKGFSNNTLSIAVWFWVVLIWMKNQEKSFWKAVLYQMLIVFVCYLSHPMGFIYSGLMIACLLINTAILKAVRVNFITGFNYFKKQFSRLLIAYIPSLILMINFLSRRSWASENNSYNSDVWKNLLALPALVDFHKQEEILAFSVSFGCIILLMISLWRKIKSKTWNEKDGLLLFFIIVLSTVVFPPGSMLGDLDVPKRLTMLPFLALLFWISTFFWNYKFKSAVLALTFLISLSFSFIRLPIQWKVSEYAKEIISCKDHILPRSTVMSLNYDLDPHSVSGKEIINRAWINTHTDGYLGVYNPLILASNYELNFDYFPFLGKMENNFYSHSSVDGIIFENIPPRANFRAYQQKTGIQIDYVILIGLKDKYKDHEYTLEILKQLNADYEKVYTSPNKIAILYKNKSLHLNYWNR